MAVACISPARIARRPRRQTRRTLCRDTCWCQRQGLSMSEVTRPLVSRRRGGAAFGCLRPPRLFAQAGARPGGRLVDGEEIGVRARGGGAQRAPFRIAVERLLQRREFLAGEAVEFGGALVGRAAV